MHHTVYTNGAVTSVFRLQQRAMSEMFIVHTNVCRALPGTSKNSITWLYAIIYCEKNRLVLNDLNSLEGKHDHSFYQNSPPINITRPNDFGANLLHRQLAYLGNFHANAYRALLITEKRTSRASWYNARRIIRTTKSPLPFLEALAILVCMTAISFSFPPLFRQPESPATAVAAGQSRSTGRCTGWSVSQGPSAPIFGSHTAGPGRTCVSSHGPVARAGHCICVCVCGGQLQT